ncbi:MAG: hypothetical protein RLN62_04590 [Rickettsiales bacterium]
MKKTIYQINSFQETDKVEGKPFTFPLASHLYYGLEYVVAGLDLNPELYNQFYMNIGDHFVMIFEICHTRIKHVITKTLPEKNLLNLLKKHNINHILDKDLVIQDDI